MKKIPCQYAIVRFSPYVETGEFANVGIVMMAPQERYFGFKLLTRRHGRITKFFEELEAKVYRSAMYELNGELSRVHEVLNGHGFDRRLKDNDIDFAKRLFAEVIRPRETIVRFGEPRVVLTENPKEKLKDLFAFYVERNFVTKEYREKVMEKGLRRLFFNNQLGDRFHPEKIGDDEFNVTFPFVEMNDEQPAKIIKALNLAQVDSMKILEHGNKWEFRIHKLREHHGLPKKVLFAVDGPDDEGGKRAKAYQEAVGKLNEAGVDVVSYKDRTEILLFATNT
jgi:hypothetical protein